MQNLRTDINYKLSSHFGTFSNKCTKGKKLPLKSDTITYLFGFNGQEKLDEIIGSGNDLDFGARVYDGRLGRHLSIDAFYKKFPNESNYSFAGNSPIIMVDQDGNKKLYYLRVIGLDGKTVSKTLIAVEKYTTLEYKYKQEYLLLPGIWDETDIYDVEQEIVLDLRTGKQTKGLELPGEQRSSSKAFNDAQDDVFEFTASYFENMGGIVFMSADGQNEETKSGKATQIENIDRLMNVIGAASSAGSMKGLTIGGKTAAERIANLLGNFKGYYDAASMGNSVGEETGLHEKIDKSGNDSLYECGSCGLYFDTNGQQQSDTTLRNISKTKTSPEKNHKSK
jgi:RHS repeat-associated protein